MLHTFCIFIELFLFRYLHLFLFSVHILLFICKNLYILKLYTLQFLKQIIFWVCWVCVCICVCVSVRKIEGFNIVFLSLICFLRELHKHWPMFNWASLVTQMVKNLPAMWETLVWSLSQEDPLGEGMAIHSTILAWRIPMEKGAWWATVNGVAQSWKWLGN